MRKMVGAPPWKSARTIFVQNNVRSFFENIRSVSYSLMCRVLTCCNQGVQAILHSDSYAMSRTRDMWSRNLHVNLPLAVFMLWVTKFYNSSCLLFHTDTPHIYIFFVLISLVIQEQKIYYIKCGASVYLYYCLFILFFGHRLPCK